MPWGNKIEFDESRVEKLYMNGLGDTEIAREVGVNGHIILNWRAKNDLPPNTGLFSWQSFRCRKCEECCKVAKHEECIRRIS